MDFFVYFYHKIIHQLKAYCLDNNISYIDNYNKFVVETPKNKDFGDISTNIAMVLSKQFNLNPELFFNNILPYLQKIEDFKEITFAKPGFINIVIKETFWHNELKKILTLKENYAKKEQNNIKVNIEFVSANPTGPLHIGNARGAVLGDILANVYNFAGFDVFKEYYVNDAGNQINILAYSIYIKYLDLLSVNHKLDNSKGYPGEYIEEIAKEIIKQHDNKFVNKDEEEWLDTFKNVGINYILKLIKTALLQLGVEHNNFASEKAIATKDNYNNLIKELEEKQLVYKGTLTPPKSKDGAIKSQLLDDYENKEQLIFKSTNFGDDMDRVLQKSNGDLTYFAGDAVYHKNKVDRGFNKLIVILGADHIGYGVRISSFVKAISNNSVEFNVLYTQMVNLMENGVAFKMSKRAGNFILLNDAIDALGVDILRFIMITRKNDVAFDFDFKKITENSMDNPLFYINYAYARIHSVIDNFYKEFLDINLDNIHNYNFEPLVNKAELDLIKTLAKMPNLIDGIIKSNDIHRIYLYLMEVAQLVHNMWNKGREDEEMRFIIKNNENLTIARVLLLKATADIIKNIMTLLKINIKTKM
jgi:arginyl-tRNA synthetase